MAMTDAELTEIVYKLVKVIFVNATAHSDRDQLKAAVDKIDDVMGATGNQIVSAGYGTTALEQAMLTECRTGAPNLTQQEAGAALAIWAMKRVGM